MSYVPPHRRMAAPVERRETWAQVQQRIAERRPQPQQPQPEPQEPASLSDWLREARRGYVPKTPEQIRAEFMALDYKKLCQRAGPPPPITSNEYGGVWEQDGGDGCVSVTALFDEDLRLFKRGIGAPPAPLFYNGDDEDEAGDGVSAAVYVGPSRDQQLRSAYASWYAQWGELIKRKWIEEHPELATKSKSKPQPKKVAQVEEPKGPSRVIEDVSEKSGW